MNYHILNDFKLIIYCLFFLFVVVQVHGTCNSKHIVVLSHGISGTSQDLNYLSNSLSKSGATILKSKSNEALNSFLGIKEGGKRLADEITDFIQKNNGDFDQISFVGNSLGGLYARYAIYLLHNSTDGNIAGLSPSSFLMIASPALGVRNFTFVDDQGYWVPDILKRIISTTMRKSGLDVFLNDANRMSQTLLYEMATEEKFLRALKTFKKRRLYANLRNDFVVPLGTAAFLQRAQIESLREKYSSSRGLVHSITVEQYPFNKNTYTKLVGNDPLDMMVAGLNSCGWEKEVVHFPGLLPIAHNMICALNRRMYWFLNDVFAEGQFLMDHASEWICPCTGNGSSTNTIITRGTSSSELNNTNEIVVE